MEHEVVHAVVAVDDGDAALGRGPGAEPVDQAVHLGDGLRYSEARYWAVQRAIWRAM
jgi:hypothetical protein